MQLRKHFFPFFFSYVQRASCIHRLKKGNRKIKVIRSVSKCRKRELLLKKKIQKLRRKLKDGKDNPKKSKKVKNKKRKQGGKRNGKKRRKKNRTTRNRKGYQMENFLGNFIKNKAKKMRERTSTLSKKMNFKCMLIKAVQSNETWSISLSCHLPEITYMSKSQRAVEANGAISLFQQKPASAVHQVIST